MKPYEEEIPQVIWFVSFIKQIHQEGVLDLDQLNTVFVELHGDLHNDKILASKDVPDCFGMLSI